MEQDSEESARFKRQLKKALIIFAIVESIVTVFVVFYMMKE